MRDPLVSFVVAAYNAEESIRTALSSILAQTHDDWEAVVVDDGSTDSTFARAAAFRDPRIRLVRLERNVGRSTARNYAIRLARGRYIAIQDADDFSHPDRLAVLLPLLDRMTDVGIVSGQHICFSDDATYWKNMRWPTKDGEIRASLLRGEMAVCHAGALIRKSVFEVVGGYDSACKRAQDLNFFIRAAERTQFASTEEVVVYYCYPRFMSPWRWFENRWYGEIAARRAGARSQFRDGVLTPARLVWGGPEYLRHLWRALNHDVEIVERPRFFDQELMHAWST